MDFTHIDSSGDIKMVDIGDKPVTNREAVAKGTVYMNEDTVNRIYDYSLPKGNVIETARLAGIMAAKQTSSLIPLCHPLLLNQVEVAIERGDNCLLIRAVVRLSGRTGAEMEALTAVAVTALTIYDMCKAVDKSMVIADIRLIQKSGGKSGLFIREE